MSGHYMYGVCLATRAATGGARRQRRKETHFISYSASQISAALIKKSLRLCISKKEKWAAPFANQLRIKCGIRQIAAKELMNQV